MIAFREYIPPFVDYREMPKWNDFDSLESLLESDVPTRYSKQADFSHFAIADKNTLMAVKNDGFAWHVVGFFKAEEPVALPEWKGWKFRALLDGKVVVLDGEEVRSSCGNVLTLKDGRKAQSIKG